jgi:uncharacterized protein YbaR (Trm112 family)
VANRNEHNPIEAVEALFACPCPQHGPLSRVGDEYVSTCCNRHFRIEDGIPVLMLEV